MASKKPSLIVRIGFFLLFRLIPLILIVGIVWSGFQIAQAMERQLDERATYAAITQNIGGAATAIVPESTLAPTETLTATASLVPASTSTSTQVPSTETSVPELTATATSTLTSTRTMLPPSETTTFTPTAISTLTTTPSATSTTTEEVLVPPQNQFSATNTPVRAVFATNTPQGIPNPTGGLATVTSQPATPVPPPTTVPTLPPTITMVPSAIPSATNTEMAETVRPLPTVFFAVSPEEGLVAGGTAVPTRVPTVPRPYNLLNVLLLGGDDTLTSDSTIRTDTMIVVSVNRDTGTVSMLSLPRDMYVWIPSGFDGGGFMGRLNVAYGVGESIGYTGGGFGLLRQTILYNFGINTHYYARVNFDGFQEIIDTLGGVEIAVDCAYQDYALIGADVPGNAVEVSEDGLWTLPVGYYSMTGAEALWYARTRGNSDDFDRGRRQQQIIRAMWRAVRDTGNLDIASLPSLWNQTIAAVDTDLTLPDILGLLPIALDLDVDDVEQFTLIRTYHTQPWQPPDGTFVQLAIYDTLRPLLEDFYLPPTESQLTVVGASVAVYNGTANTNWDRVAAESLAWDGFLAWAAGDADSATYEATILIDRTGQQKGSSRDAIASSMNVRSNNILIEPDANREADFEVILGENHDFCNAAVLAVETPGDE